MDHLQAFLDDSGSFSDPNNTYMTIAGFVSTPDRWNHFATGWVSILREFGIDSLHMRDFNDKNSQTYKRLKADLDAEASFISDLIGLTKQTVTSATEASIRISDFKEFCEHNGVRLNPYATAIYGCIICMRMKYPCSKIEIIVDRFSKAPLACQLALAYARSDAKRDLNVDQITIRPLAGAETSKTVLPMQAADMLSWEMRKLVEDRSDWTYSQSERQEMRLGESYNHYHSRYLGRFGSPPRERRSFLSLLNGETTRPHGVILDRWSLEKLQLSHPVGWGVV